MGEPAHFQNTSMGEVIVLLKYAGALLFNGVAL
jgi:hypothetical protein